MGFDIIVQSDGVPLLLEVNSAPSLNIEHVNIKNNLNQSNLLSPVRSIVDEVTFLIYFFNTKNIYNFKDDQSAIST